MLTVLVSPVKVAVEEGAQAIIDCAVMGNLIEKMKWSRDILEIINDNVRIYADPHLIFYSGNYENSSGHLPSRGGLGA